MNWVWESVGEETKRNSQQFVEVMVRVFVWKKCILSREVLWWGLSFR